jgi:hypothetical protein
MADLLGECTQLCKIVAQSIVTAKGTRRKSRYDVPLDGDTQDAPDARSDI